MRSLVLAVVCAATACLGSAAESRESVYHEGDLVLSGTDRMVIENTVYHQNGDILLSDSATLVVRNADVVVSARSATVFSGRAAEFILLGAAHAEISNTHITVESDAAENPWLNVSVENASTLSLSAVVADNTKVFVRGNGLLQADGSTVSEVCVSGSSRSDLRNCVVRWAICLDFGTGDRVTLSRLAPGRIASWMVPIAVAASVERPRLSLLDCSIGAWSVYAIDSVVTLQDSVVARLGLYWSNPSGTIVGLAPGRFPEWHLSEQLQTEGLVDVTMLNTTITDCVSLGLRHGSGTLTVQDSSVALQVSDFTGHLNFQDSALSTMTVDGSSLDLDMTASTVEAGFDVTDSTLRITGNFSPSAEAAFYQWSNSRCSREFVVSVRRANGRPASYASVHVGSPSRASSDYTCDADGNAQITVSFTDATRDRSFWVSTDVPGGREVRVTAYVLSSSPLVLVVP